MTIEEALETIAQIIEPRQLNKIQQLILQYIWQGLSYSEIARITDYDEGYIKDAGSKLWQSLSKCLAQKVTKQNIQAVLKQYSRQNREFNFTSSQKQVLTPSQDWGEAVDTSIFYGRSPELTTLKQWIIEDKCRLIAILGMGGMGKTTLLVKLAEQVQKDFDYLIWRSLRDAPPLDELLTTLLQFLSPENNPLPNSEGGKLNQLQKCLQSARCLIVLDNFETLLASQQQNGLYRLGYEGYGDLLRRIGELRHSSCVIITSREMPREITWLQGESLPVRAWQLLGLETTAAQMLLEIKGIAGSPEIINNLVKSYQGNPLALKIAASSIQNLFAGSISDFFQQGAFTFDGISHLLFSQIERLSDLEQQVMYWLTINREPVSLNELQSDLFPPSSISVLLKTLESLKGRSLIERTAEGFTQQPVIMEYISEQLIVQIGNELIEGNLITSTSFVARYALLKATAKDYIRSSQIRTIIEPLVSQTIARLGSKQVFIEKLNQVLWQLNRDKLDASGYTVGNLLNLFNYLQVDLTGFDFSHLSVWQAYLAEVKLPQVNFAYADLSRSVFAKTFGGVSCVAFSRDGQRLATSDTSGESQIWDLTSSKQINAFKTDLVWTWAVAFNQDGKLVASAGDDYLVKLWDVETGKCLKVFKGHTNTINALAFHPQDDLLASCSLDATIRLWHINQIEPNLAVNVLESHQGRVWSVAFSPDGSALVSGSEDLTIKLWDVKTLRCRKTLKEHTHWVKTVAWSPDGEMIASGSFDGTIKCWSVATGECVRSWQGHHETVTTITFSPDHRLLASSSYDQTVKVWDVTSGQCLKTLTGHSNRVWSVGFSPNGQFLASGGDDHATRLWNLRTGQCAKTWKGHTNSILFLALAPEKQLLATGHEDQTVKIWNLQTGQIKKVLRGHENRVWSVRFAPQLLGHNKDEMILASSSADRTIKIWNVDSGVCLKTLQGHQSWVWSVNFSRDGNYLVSGSYDKSIKLWDVEMGECLKTLEGHTAPIITVAFSPDNLLIASCSFDSTIKLWDIQTGQCFKTLLGHQNSVWTIAFSQNGDYLVSGSYDHTVKLWDLQTGTCLSTFSGHSAPVMSLAFSSNGKLLVSGSFDQTLKVWDINTGICLRTFYGHTGLISALIFQSANSSDLDNNEILISGSFDETIRFWDFQTGECLQTFRTPRPYDGMNITGATGLNEAQKATLRALGADEKG
jgi:WD40 repeat protein